MTPPQPRPPRPKSLSPAERSAEFAEVQRVLKEEAAERRAKAAEQAPTPQRSKPRARRG
jgi:hypothetical protein